MKVYEFLKVEHVNIKRRIDNLSLYLNEFTNRKEENKTCCKIKSDFKKSSDNKKNFIKSFFFKLTCYFCEKLGHKIDTCFKKRNFDGGTKMMWVKENKSIIHKEKKFIRKMTLEICL